MNERFLNLYNQLDHCLKYLVGNPYIKNYISYYEVTLPPESRSLLEEIRLFKNAHKSHGVSNHDEPIAPESWNRFLEAHIAHVKKNPATVKQNVERAIREAAEEKRRKRGFKGGKNSNSNPQGFRSASPSNSYGRKAPPKQRKCCAYPLPNKAYPACFWDRLLSEFTFSKRYLRIRKNVDFPRWQEKIMAIIRYELGRVANLKKENVRFTKGSFKCGPECFRVPSKETPLPYGTKVCTVSYIDPLEPNKKHVFLFNNIGETFGSYIYFVGKADQYRSNAWTDFETRVLTYYELNYYTSIQLVHVLSGGKIILNAD